MFRGKEAKLILLSLAAATLYSGCQLISRGSETSPTATPAPILTSEPTVPPLATPTPISPGTQYDRLLWFVDRPDNRYEAIQGGFLPNGEMWSQTMSEYFSSWNGKNRLPISILFKDVNNQSWRLIFSGAFISNTFMVMGQNDTDVCAPPSEEKIDAYRRLTLGFNKGDFVDRELLNRIARGASPDCNYYGMKEGYPPFIPDPSENYPLLLPPEPKPDFAG